MRYLIDGHNLIPKLPDLDLRDIDDEIRLVSLLQEYCRRSRNRVEVYFDNAPIGHTGARKFGLVTAYFIPQRRAADDAIRARLGKLGREARNWSVVSSDQQVQTDARAVHAQVVSSEKFSRELLSNLEASAGDEKPTDAALNQEELAAWIELFNRRSQKPK